MKNIQVDYIIIFIRLKNIIMSKTPENIIKILIITVIVLVALIEGVYLFVVPSVINGIFDSNKAAAFVKEKTGLTLIYKTAKIKTYPSFSMKFEASDVLLKDKKSNKIFSARNFETKIGLPSLFVKKVTVKTLLANNLNFSFSRNKDKKFYLGDYLLNFDPKKEVNIDINKLNVTDSSITFDDKLINQKTVAKIKDANLSYKKNKSIKTDLIAVIFVNNKKKTLINFELDSKLPLSKGLKSDKVRCNGFIKDLDLSDYSGYFAYLLDEEVVSASGLINARVDGDKKGNFNVSASMKDFALNMKNPLDSIRSEDAVELVSILNFEKNNLKVNKAQIKSNKWCINIEGNIKNYLSKKAVLDLLVDIPESDIHSLYWLVPSIKDDPLDVMQKFKKYGAWGKAAGRIIVKGKASLPEIYGDLTASDVYIVKDNPLVPHCKIFAKFLGHQVKVTTRVFAGHGEYVDIDGVAEMKIYGAGDFHVVSSDNVDLSTADYMLVPVHEVVGFDLGPVPYMDITGKGNIDIRTRGTVLDGEVFGKFNFKNTNASLQGLNTTIQKANGTLDFDRKNMHFYTTSARINNQPIKIDGRANLSGDIDFDITSDSIDLADLFSILTTSSILESKKVLVEPIEKLSGKVKTAIKVKGFAKDFGALLKNPNLLISGVINLKDCTGKTKYSPLYAKKLNGVIKFHDMEWFANMKGLVGTSDISINGESKAGRTNILVNAPALKTDEIIDIIYTSQSKNTKLPRLPKTHSLMSINAKYQSDKQKFDLNNLSAKGMFKPAADGKDSPEFFIASGSFNLAHGNLAVKNFNARLFNSKIIADGKVADVFSQNYSADGRLNISDFDISAFNSIKNMNFLPVYVKKLLQAYENYQGRADVDVVCNNNRLKGKINLREIKFNHSYFKTPVTVERGMVFLDGTKITLHSIVAQVDNTPVFMNISVWDLDKTLKFSGYFTTKLTEYFANKYINSFLTYPIKPRGDITVTADIDGNLNNFRLRPKLKFAQDADIYYMGANLGDDTEDREIKAEINIGANNVYYLKKLDYTRFMTSQNNKIYPLTVLRANGVFQSNKKKIYIRNLNIETLNNANVKMFNVIFKKSVLKNGMFNCKLNIKGYVDNPHIRGSVFMDNLDMPLYDTIIKGVVLHFKEKSVDIKASGVAFASDFVLTTTIQNHIKPPIVIEDMTLKSQKFNLDTLIDSLTRIPTPDTSIRLVDQSKNSTKLPLDISDFQIKKGTLMADEVVIRNLTATNYLANFSMTKDMLLNLNKMSFDVTTGKILGTASYDFSNGLIKANLSALNVDANKIASSFFDFSDQIFGTSNGNIVITTSGNSEIERIKNMFGYVYFEIADGKMPKLGSVEYLLKAGNFIKSGITGASISNFIDLIAPIKTGYFESIKGSFALKNGVAQNIEIYSKGENLNIYINGEYDILQNYANLRVFGRLTKRATNILGAVGNISFNTLLNKIPGFKLGKEDKLRLIKDLNKIPGVELSDQQYRVFTAKIDGNINENKYVKNFRWIE